MYDLTWHRDSTGRYVAEAPAPNATEFAAVVSREGNQWRVITRTFGLALSSRLMRTMVEAKAEAQSTFWNVAGVL